MSADAANDFADNISRRIKEYLDQNPDVAQQIFGSNASVELRAESDPAGSPGFDVLLSEGEFKRVTFEVEPYAS